MYEDQGITSINGILRVQIRSKLSLCDHKHIIFMLCKGPMCMSPITVSVFA